MCRIIIFLLLLVRAMGRHGFLVYFPRRFGMQLPLVAMVLREASALMRISSYTAVHNYCNPRCACAPRVNNNAYYLCVILIPSLPVKQGK